VNIGILDFNTSSDALPNTTSIYFFKFNLGNFLTIWAIFNNLGNFLSNYAIFGYAVEGAEWDHG
jgi:hypothetical protein